MFAKGENIGLAQHLDFLCIVFGHGRLELDHKTAALLLRHAIDNVFHLCHALELREQSVCHTKIQKKSSKSKANQTLN